MEIGMGYVLLGLLVLALLLFVLSLFQKDHMRLMREELDEFSLQQLQENYQIKKKMKVFEEELLMGDDFGTISPRNNGKKTVHEILKNQVISLAQQGSSVEQISKQSSLPEEEVRSIITEHRMRGNEHE